jgi:MFS family permease
VLQGLGGGMLMPIGMAVLYRLTPPARRGAIFGLFGLPVMVAPALGPLLSGWVLTYYYWGSVFLITLPLLVVVFPMALKLVPAHVNETTESVDNLGGVLSVVLVAALILWAWRRVVQDKLPLHLREDVPHTPEELRAHPELAAEPVPS